METNPDNEDGVVLVAYFEGPPTEDELEDAAENSSFGTDAVGGHKERRANEVSKRAGLERWLLWPAD
jgi:hypothetical protein